MLKKADSSIIALSAVIVFCSARAAVAKAGAGSHRPGTQEDWYREGKVNYMSAVYDPNHIFVLRKRMYTYINQPYTYALEEGGDLENDLNYNHATNAPQHNVWANSTEDSRVAGNFGIEYHSIKAKNNCHVVQKNFKWSYFSQGTQYINKNHFESLPIRSRCAIRLGAELAGGTKSIENIDNMSSTISGPTINIGAISIGRLTLPSVSVTLQVYPSGSNEPILTGTQKWTQITQTETVSEPNSPTQKPKYLIQVGGYVHAGITISQYSSAYCVSTLKWQLVPKQNQYAQIGQHKGGPSYLGQSHFVFED